jgi:hypothetical protein
MIANGTTVPQYSCAVHFYFSDRADPVIKYSINTATYLFSTKSNVNSQYCATTVSITPSTQPSYGGQQLTCHADAFPPPNFVWIDNLKGGATVASEANFTLPVDGGQFNLNCTALSTGSVSCNTSTSFSGFAVVCPSNATISPTNYVPQVGETFNCSSKSNPGANYTWYNSTGATLSTQSTLTVNSPGDFTFTCVASVSAYGAVCSVANTSISGTAILCPKQRRNLSEQHGSTAW